MRRLLVPLLLASVTISGAQRRAVLPPQPPPLATWLAANAHPIATNDATGDLSDLAPFGEIVGDAPVVGVGDVTHGTHECATLKRRLFEYLVREKGFQVVAVEGGFTNFNAINAYAQGAPGDINALLVSRNHYYFFWEYQEIADFVNWMRDYNLHRAAGTPALEIVGIDLYEIQDHSAAVLSYLGTVDPPAASAAKVQYDCMTTIGCQANTASIRNALTSKQSTYVPLTGQRAYDDALHSAQVIVEYTTGFNPGAGRDEMMARYVLWARDHRGTNRKLLLWAHDDHVGRTFAQGIPQWNSVGMQLTKTLGRDYVAVGITAVAGSFTTRTLPTDTTPAHLETATLSPPAFGSFEALLGTSGLPRMIISLHGLVPKELQSSHELRMGGTSGEFKHDDVLPVKWDAVIQLQQTTPAQ